MQIKLIIRHHLMPVGMDITIIGEDVEKREPHTVVVIEKQHGGLSKIKNRSTYMIQKSNLWVYNQRNEINVLKNISICISPVKAA